MNGTSVDRREMALKSFGTLVKEHQNDVITFVLNVSQKVFKNKPASLRSYEFDVLYPEVIF